MELTWTDHCMWSVASSVGRATSNQSTKPQSRGALQIHILLVHHLYHIQILMISVVNTLFQIMMNLKEPCQFLTALVTLIPFSQNSKFWLQLVIGLKKKQFVFF